MRGRFALLLLVVAFAAQGAADAVSQGELLQEDRGLEWSPRKLLAAAKPAPEQSAKARMRDKRIEARDSTPLNTPRDDSMQWALRACRPAEDP